MFEAGKIGWEKNLLVRTGIPIWGEIKFEPSPPPPPQKSKILGYLSNKHIQCFCMGVSPLGVGTWCNWGGGEYSRGGEFYKIPVQVFLEFSLFLENYHWLREIWLWTKQNFCRRLYGIHQFC